MAVDKKDFDIDPASGVAAAPDDVGVESSDATPRRKKRTGLRVPSDNVPRPDGRTGRTLPPGEIAAVAPAAPGEPVPHVVTIMPARPPTVPGAQAVMPSAMPPPASEAGIMRLGTEDLEVDVEFIEDGNAIANGSRAQRAATDEDRSAGGARPLDDYGDAGLPALSDGVPAQLPVEPSWTPPADFPTDELTRDLAQASAAAELASIMPPDDMAGEPTVIGPPPQQFMAPSPPPPPATPVSSSSANSATASGTFTSTTSRWSDSGPVSAPTTDAPDDSDDDASDEAEVEITAASEDAEELSPTEFEEVESGPTPTSVAAAGAPTGRASSESGAGESSAGAPAAPMSGSSSQPSAPVLATSASGAAPAASQPPAGSPGGPRLSVPPPPPPASSSSSITTAPSSAKAPPQPPPAPKAAAAAAAAAAAGQPKTKKRKGKAWFEEIFDEDYLRTLPFLTPQATQREAAFIADVLGIKPGMQVLDLGCGYGRHAMELAARGHHVVGLDLSLPLLIRGADEAQRRGLNINFVHGDMRELTFDAQFDGAYCVFSTFGYFDDETNKRVAVNLARALKPGAKLVIDVLNRDYVIADLPTRVWWEGDGCVVLEEVDFNYFTSRVISNRSVVFEDGRQLEQEISMRSYSLHELGKLLHTAGFRVIEVSGGLATRGRFFGNESRQIIVVAEKRPEAGAVGGGNTPTSPPPLESGPK